MVSEITQKALFDIIKQCFVENRIIDRMVSVIGVNFACNQTSNLIHYHIAHYFPSLSDKFGELCLERYNISVVYGETPAAYENYDSLTQIIEMLEKRIKDFQTMLMGVCKIAYENNDINVWADLIELLQQYNFIVEQSILLVDKIHNYTESNIMSFDHDIIETKRLNNSDCFTTIHIYADDGKVFKRISTNEVLTNHIGIGSEDSISNYEEIFA